MFPHKTVKVQRCPLCGGLMWGVPVVSRVDNRTPICPDCGVRQAMASIGVDEADTEGVLDAIHKYERRG